MSPVHARADLALAVAAAWADLPRHAILASGRGTGRLAVGRHVAFYLAHVTCGLSQHETARRFLRHHSSIAHGCRSIEEARERPDFDRLMTRLEEEVRRALHLAGLGGGEQ